MIYLDNQEMSNHIDIELNNWVQVQTLSLYNLTKNLSGNLIKYLFLMFFCYSPKLVDYLSIRLLHDHWYRYTWNLGWEPIYY